jgi:hypothetical protein
LACAATGSIIAITSYGTAFITTTRVVFLAQIIAGLGLVRHGRVGAILHEPYNNV